MAYQPNIPQPTDQLSNSQADLLGNFQTIGNMMAPGGSTAGTGGVVKFTTAGGDPAAIASTIQMYAKNGVNGNPQLFIERENGSADIPVIINFTEKGLLSNPDPNMTAAAWSRDPSGVLNFFGRIPMIPSGATVTYATLVPSFPGFSAIFSIVITPYASGGGKGASLIYVSENSTLLSFSMQSVQDATLAYFNVKGI